MATNEGRIVNEEGTKVLTGEVRFSYVHVFEPKAMDGSSDEKYSVSLIIPKTDKKTVSAIRQALKNAAEIGKNTKFAGKVPKDFDKALRDGDEERSDDENYANSYFVNATSKGKPGVVDKYRKVITDETEFYSGCFGHASLNFYPFNSNGNRGVACGLNNLMKTKEGTFLGGRASAESDFADLEFEFDDEFGDLEDDDDLGDLA